MIAMSIDATTLAHGVHYGVLAVGFAGLLAVLAPHRLLRAAPPPRDEHELRVRALVDQIAGGTLGTAPTPPTSPAPSSRTSRGAALLLPLAVVGSAAAAGVHAAVGPAHLREQLLFGLFFLGTALAQVLWSVAVVLRPTRALLQVGLVGNLAVVSLWAATRSVGLGPLLPRPEAVGPWDVCCALWELTTAATCFLLLRDRARREGLAPWSRWRRPAQTFALGSAVVLGLLTVSGAGA